MNTTFNSKTAAVCTALLVWSAGSAAQPEEGAQPVPAFELPLSTLLGEESRTILKQRNKESAAVNELCSIDIDALTLQSVRTFRHCQEQHHYPSLLARHKARYPVKIASQVIAGVPTETFTPVQGVAAANRQRVLINLHGGGFIVGGRWGGQVESIPIASLGRIKVVSVDYRMAPEHRFPAASEDVAAVYRELLKTYQPRDIGIYGCSAGGLLTAQAVAWLQREGLPAPGAVGILCSGAGYWGEGDSGHFTAARQGTSIKTISDPQTNPYFEDTAANDPLAFPIRSDHVLAGFPPSLLIASTRDLALSSAVHLHSRLVALGVPAQLNVWEGLDHAFFFEPDLPESREVYDVIVRFFDNHLGRQTAASRSSESEPEPTLAAHLEKEIERFVAADRNDPPPPCQVLFVGSSSIVQWRTLAVDMAPLPVLNRGFGGSQIEHVNRWFDAIVTPYRPRAIVFYAGENDIAAGKPVKNVIADFDAFMARKTAALGDTPVYFISLKPSKLRFWQFEAQTRVNDAIRAQARRRADLHYVDVAAPMLDAGKPKDIFVADNLHMAPQGYEIWTEVVKPALLPNTEAEARRCNRTH